MGALADAAAASALRAVLAVPGVSVGRRGHSEARQVEPREAALEILSFLVII